MGGRAMIKHKHFWQLATIYHDDKDVVPQAVWFVCECGKRKCITMSDLSDFAEARNRLKKLK